MSTSSTFKTPLNMTFITTATTIMEVDGVTFLTDPFFSEAGASFDTGVGVVLEISEDPALKLNQIPPIDAVLLSHEDHFDNLDPLGRQLLDGRRVITTMDGAKNLKPRPGVVGIQPWQTVPLTIGGKDYKVTGVPCQHLPGGECTGFLLQSERFGETDGKPNVIYFAGDTVYIDDLVHVRDNHHISVAIFNLGCVKVNIPDQGPLQITMGGAEAAKLAREIGADVVVPIHYESWNHFTEHGEELRKIFEEEKISDKVCWLEPGVSKRVI
ncbi:MAG: beta-lactamase superfamily domain-containing protein [Benjaminiella poitrasii]|nr:MAG: beta-lactamase superfamily domain-containing protein [Benjaminiella poitrasii]